MAHWEVLDHTADLALEACGDSPEQTLQLLLEGLLAQITDPAVVRPEQAVPVVAKGLDLAECLVTALGEVLYWINEKGWLFSRFEVGAVGGTEIQLNAWGEPRDAARHPFDLEVKAATYHELHLGHDESTDGWRLRVIFDV